MDLSPDARFLDATRRDGWAPALKARFVALLAETGNVRLAARRCEMSAQSAYVQRRRDPLFARGWAVAMVRAQEHAEQVLADRAIEGVEEEIYYRGELVGTRRRYDSRLLLAHLARLDRQVERGGVNEDAARFDELIALIAGTEPPEDMAYEDDLPSTRDEHVRRMGKLAEHEVNEGLDDADHDPESWEELVRPAWEAARDAAYDEWIDWIALAHETADRVIAEAAELLPQDRVNPSTSPCENPPRNGEVAGPQGLTEGALVETPCEPSCPPAVPSAPDCAGGPPSRAGEDLAGERARIVQALAARAGSGEP